MNQPFTSTVISTDTVAQLEARLDHADVCALIFLLYEHEETALQHVCHEIQSSRKYQPVLDSVLFRVGETFHEGALARWARSRVNNDDHWQDKLLEALLIIKNYWIIKLLGKRKEDLDLKFLPSQHNTSSHIDLVRKSLFLMVDNMSIHEWNQLQTILSSEATKLNVIIPRLYCNVPESFLLFLMSRNVIKTRKGGEKMDFVLLRSSLKSMDFYYWSQQLKDVENVINGVDNSSTDAVQDLSKDLPRFNLDSQNPGTILIFNLENYDQKSHSGSSKPLTRRKGSHVDCERLTKTFALLGFKVLEPVNDPSSKQIIQHIKTDLKKFCEEAKENKKERCFVVAILAHGDTDGVYGMDGVVVKWDSIRAELRRSDTVGLPRLLLIQACKGASQVTKASEKLEVVEDGPSSLQAHSGNLRDLFELSASVSGFAAYRSETLGSFFIRSICKQILLFGREVDLHRLALLINRDFDNKNLVHQGKCVFMTSELNVTSSKALYLGVPEGMDDCAKELVRKWENIDALGESDPASSRKNTEKHGDEEKDLKARQTSRSPREEEFYKELKAMALLLGKTDM